LQREGLDVHVVAPPQESLARGNGHTKVLCQIDNVEPHEQPQPSARLGTGNPFAEILEQRMRREERRPKEPYLKQIAASGLQEEVLLHDRFIPDAGVKDYFSAADFVVQPYKTATQSGVTQIAYQFCTPMVVTDVGGLAEIVPDGKVGVCLRPDRGGDRRGCRTDFR